MTLVVIGACDAYMQKSNVSHEVGMRPGRWASHNYVIAGP